MTKRILFIVLVLSSIRSYSQQLQTDTLFKKEQVKPVTSQSLYSDSLVSTFAIAIKDEVKPHKHLYHTEQVMIVSGEGIMTLNGKTFAVKEGDLVFIPKGQIHALKVTKSPVKVISIQTPFFDGKDRVFTE
jgi:quercetin dioxygenase-like cupin family protein